eukprot:TRINITY_DN3399_c0_g2_i1.p1 TRINITY_DN3399_c0_g2~~TRINITY_DN3399_c0_g2_i1.p1  ORF type:complete len:1213 (+),score=503.34 TRINITY_DN3399_c0_g2_i1:154-3792(+)
MSLQLYNLTLEKGGAIQCCCPGSFSAPKTTEIAAGRGHHIELLRVVSGELVSVSIWQTFGIVRQLMPFRLPGANRDFLVAASDAGRIVVLEYDAAKNEWAKIQQETYGKSGCRRAVPGEYLAVDPRGHAVMIGAIEKQKFGYILQPGANTKPTISSPLEAHKSHVVTYSLIALDMEYENPVFAAVEVDHSEMDEDAAVVDAEKNLIFYEIDLGLNHVVRKTPSDEPLPSSANLLFALPGGQEGPGGVLVCCDNYFLYMNTGHAPLKEVIPRRQDMAPTAPLMIVAGALFKPEGRTKKNYFFLMQSEYGDLYKVTFNATPTMDAVKSINVQYFDTVPVATKLLILRSGHLFCATESGNNRLFVFQALGDDDDDRIIGAMALGGEDGVTEPEYFPLFTPRSLKNLAPVQETDSLCPLLDAAIAPPVGVSESKRVMALCGRGAGSSLRVLQHGLALSELASFQLPGLPEKVWTLQESANSAEDSHIVVSFSNGTLVFAIGEVIEEVQDKQLNASIATHVCRTLADDSILQVTAEGIWHIRKDHRINQWSPPGKKRITMAEANARQVAVVLGGSEVIYFELDPQLSQFAEVAKKDMQKEITCLGIGPIPEGKLRSRFLAIGFADRRVNLLSLDPEENLKTLSRQNCSSEPESVKLVGMHTEAADRDQVLMMFIGCANGIVVRSILDRVSGEITDVRTRFCGTKACDLVQVKAGGKDSMLVLSSRSWLSYHYQNTNRLSPLCGEAFAHASPFSSSACPEGIVAIAGNSLKIMALERLGNTFNQTVAPLKATPRGFVKHPFRKYIVTVESDHRAFTEEEKANIKAQLRQSLIDQGEEVPEQEDLPEKDYGPIKAPTGKWCSYIRIVDPDTLQTVDLVELDENQAAVSCAAVVFHDTGGEVHLVVGTVKDMVPNPQSHSSGLLLVFKFAAGGTQLNLVHKTVVDGIPKAIHPFQGRVLVGVDNRLKMYDLGKMKLLNKCENRQVPHMIVSITSVDNRVFVGDSRDSVFALRYRKEANQMSLVADDSLPRWTTCVTPLDHRTLALGDKLGNVTVVRLPDRASEEFQGHEAGRPASGANLLRDQGFLHGAQYKFDVVASFFVGSRITNIQKTSLSTGGQEVVLYTTLNGTIGCMLPITSRNDAELLKVVQNYMRQERPPLLGRDHLAFRSYYTPQRAVIDGDLVELFSSLPHEAQVRVAEEVGRQPAELSKRLEDFRAKVL